MKRATNLGQRYKLNPYVDMYRYLSVYVIPRFHTFWNIRHNLGWSAIHVASVNGQQEILKILLENGADPDLTDEFVNIYQTAREKNLQSLDVMVAREEEFNSNLNLRANFRGCTALHYAALADDYESIRILLGMCNPKLLTILANATTRVLPPFRSLR